MTPLDSQPVSEPLKILLVEDEEAHARIIERSFENQGAAFELKVSSTLAEAAEALRVGVFDLVITDWRLPDGEGFELLKDKPRFPLLIMTSHGNEKIAVEAMRAGALDYVTKSESSLLAMPRIADRAIRLWTTLAAKELAREKLRIAEQALHERRREEEWFRLVVEADLNAMIVTSADGLITVVNSRTEGLFGYQREEMMGQSAEMLLPPRFRAGNDSCRNLFAAPPEWGLGQDLFGSHKDGREIPIEIGLSPIDTSEGQFVLASIADITERKLSERRLRESEHSLRLLADAMPQIVWTANPNGHVDYFNRRWYEFTGSTEGESGDGSWERTLHPDDLQPSRDCWYSAMSSGGTYEIQARLLDRKSGDYRWYLARAVPQRDDFGAIFKWVGTATDVHDQKQLSEELEERVELRTAELRRSLLEKTTLLKEVHHRVKNNLQIICSLLSMQIECSVDDSFTGPLNTAHSRVLAMSLIHEQIYQSETLADLNFGRYIESLAEKLFGAYCIDPGRIRLELGVQSVHLSLDQAIPCGLILNELLANSFKHAFSDGREGVIRVSLKQKEGNSVELAVADNGIGLPVDFQWKESRSLGLQVVRTLIHQLRADLQVTDADATQKGGACFSFAWKSDMPVHTQ